MDQRGQKPAQINPLRRCIIQARDAARGQGSGSENGKKGLDLRILGGIKKGGAGDPLDVGTLGF